MKRISALLCCLCILCLAATAPVLATYGTDTNGEQPSITDSTNYGGKQYWESRRGAAVACQFTFPASSSTSSPHGVVTVITQNQGNVSKPCSLNGTNATVYCGESLVPTVTVSPQAIGSHFSLRGFVGWAEQSGSNFNIYGYYCISVGDYCFGSGPGVQLYGPADPNVMVFNVKVECHRP